MDSLVVNELAAHYRSRVLRFTPEILGSFGFNRNSGMLELAGTSLSCIPYELSVGTASLLAVLSDGEVEHFLARKDSPSKLTLLRKIPDSEKPEVFYITAHLVDFQRPNPGSAYCVIHVQLVRLPHELKEMLVSHFFQVDQADAFVKNLNDALFAEEDIRAVFRTLHLTLIKENAVGERLKILSYSSKKLQVFGEITGTVPVVGEKTDWQPSRGDKDCQVTAVCTGIRTFPELPGFWLLDLDQVLSLGVVKKLMKYAKTAKTRFLNSR